LTSALHRPSRVAFPGVRSYLARPNEARLLPLITGLFRKPDSVANGQAVKAPFSDVLEMKVNLAIIGRSDKTVVSIWKERLDHAARCHLLGLAVPLPLVHHVFELTVRGTEGVLDGRLLIAVVFANARIVVDVDVSASR
jgi:hypothetical protein